jgi:hypothetical protein
VIPTRSEILLRQLPTLSVEQEQFVEEQGHANTSMRRDQERCYFFAASMSRIARKKSRTVRLLRLACSSPTTSLFPDQRWW